jgi:hypothetical protein
MTSLPSPIAGIVLIPWPSWCSDKNVRGAGGDAGIEAFAAIIVRAMDCFKALPR